MNYHESIRIIKQAMRDNKLVVFVGAGASFYSGIPLWFQAVKKICEHLENAIITDADYLTIPQFYFNARGGKEYNEFMKTVFKYDDKQPNKIHDLITELNPLCVITTNYDDFLERSFWGKGEFLEVIEHDADIPYAKTDRLIIKMHGGFAHSNFVLKEDDYLNYSSNFPLIETYVKSLMAKNVVLFIGYSYNDPDTKQIMNWVKCILGRDHQRAYMLEPSKPYDPNNENYYKNLGVNILYTRQCDESTNPCWVCKNGTDECGSFQNTINFLNELIMDKDDIDIINSIYDELLPLNDLNHILSRHIIPALNKHTEANVVNTHVVYDNMIVESIRQIEMIEKFNSNEIKTNNKLAMILGIFEKTRIARIFSNLRHSGMVFAKTEEIYVLAEQNPDDYLAALDSSNLCELRKFSDNFNLYGDKICKQSALRVAYTHFTLKNYSKCLNILKNLASKFLREKNSTWYFICEFNRHYVGKMIEAHLENATLADEAKKINLEKVQSRISKSKHYNRILSDLLDLKLIFNFLSDVHKMARNVEKDAKTNYSFNKNIPAFANMEAAVIDFYLYLSRNFIMIDSYIEVIDIYTAFIDAVFYSHSKKEVINNNGFFGAGRNVVLKELSPFMVMIICKYIDKKEIVKLIQKHSIKEIHLDDRAEHVLFEIFENLEDAFLRKVVKPSNVEQVWTILYVLGYMKNSSKCFSKTLDIISNLIENNYFSHDRWKNISNFLTLQYRINLKNVSASSIHRLINVISHRLHTNSNDPQAYDADSLLKNCCFMLSEIDESLRIDNDAARNLISDLNYPVLISIYPVASDSLKKNISLSIASLLETSISPDIYQGSIMAKIVEKSQKFEDMLLELLVSSLAEKQAHDAQGITSQPCDFEIALSCCINLFLNDELLDPNKFESFFQHGSDKIKFLYDMSNFDYSLFDLNWLNSFNDKLMQKVSSNEVAYDKIRELYKSTFLNDEYDSNMMERFFKYFDN